MHKLYCTLRNYYEAVFVDGSVEGQTLSLTLESKEYVYSETALRLVPWEHAAVVGPQAF